MPGVRGTQLPRPPQCLTEGVHTVSPCPRNRTMVRRINSMVRSKHSVAIFSMAAGVHTKAYGQNPLFMVPTHSLVRVKLCIDQF